MCTQAPKLTCSNIKHKKGEFFLAQCTIRSLNALAAHRKDGKMNQRSWLVGTFASNWRFVWKTRAVIPRKDLNTRNARANDARDCACLHVVCGVCCCHFLHLHRAILRGEPYVGAASFARSAFIGVARLTWISGRASSPCAMHTHTHTRTRSLLHTLQTDCAR